MPLFVFVLANGRHMVSERLPLLMDWCLIGIHFSIFSCSKNGTDKDCAKIKRNRHVKRVMKVVEERGFSMLFILLCFPFSPSAIINVVAGLSNIKLKPFILAVFLGKAVMIFSIAYIGSSIVEFYRNPVKTIIIIVCISVFLAAGKFIEKRFIK